MDKIVIGEITLIFIFFILLSNDSINFFLMETIFGNMLTFLAFFIYYYLDKYIGVVFCFMIIYVHYNSPIEPFFNNTIENAKNPVVNSEEYFRKTNCFDNKLLYKGKEVKNDMVEHIYPEINFENNTCNPCDKKCDITILEEGDGSSEQEFGFSTLA
jgi:hypothetical protein